VRYYPCTADSSVSIVTTARGCTIGGLIPGWVKRLFSSPKYPGWVKKLFSSPKYPDHLQNHPAFYSIGIGVLFHGWELNSKS
jgi:hypothetical protein